MISEPRVSAIDDRACMTVEVDQKKAELPNLAAVTGSEDTVFDYEQDRGYDLGEGD